MKYYVEDAVAWVADAGSFRELVRVVRQLAEELPANKLDGEPITPELAREMRAAIIELLRAETLPALEPHEAVEILDVLADHNWCELEPMRQALARESASVGTPPAGPSDEERVELLIAAGRLAEARSLCEQVATRHREDEESCMRAGDFGQATKAERKKLAWLERSRTL